MTIEWDDHNDKPIAPGVYAVLGFRDVAIFVDSDYWDGEK